MDPIQQNGYSAEVRLELRVQGETFPLASIGPNDFIPREPLDLPSCDAEIVMFIDGEGFLWPVRLPHGVVPFEKKVETQTRGEMQRIGRSSETIVLAHSFKPFVESDQLQ